MTSLWISKFYNRILDKQNSFIKLFIEKSFSNFIFINFHFYEFNHNLNYLNYIFYIFLLRLATLKWNKNDCCPLNYWSNYPSWEITQSYKLSSVKMEIMDFMSVFKMDVKIIPSCVTARNVSAEKIMKNVCWKAKSKNLFKSYNKK